MIDQVHSLFQEAQSLWKHTNYTQILATTFILIIFSYFFKVSISSFRTTRKQFRWNEQLAIVTGASGGLGKCIALQLIERGCGGIVCVDIKPSIDNDWQSGSENENERILNIQCDVSNSKEVTKLSEEISKTFPTKKITILISNAGIMIGKPLLELKEGEFEKTINVNLISSFYLLKEFLPQLIKNDQGHFIATSSIMGYVGISRLSDYVASKHGLIGLVESLRYELDKVYKKPKIKTSLLILGQLKTPLFENVKMSWLGGLLMPIQDPKLIAKDVLNALENEKSTYIYRPFLARLAPILQAMPIWIRNLAQTISGADEAFQSLTS